MPSYDPNLFNVEPYYDDYSEDKKHLRIMFRPGYGVQARELTQLQTIIQNQIERFGSHIFDEGSIVLDGQITNNRVKYARLYNLGSGVTHSDFIGTNIYSSAVNTGVYGRVVHAEGGIVGDPNPVLFFEYMVGGTGFTSAEGIFATAANDVRITASITGPVGNANVISVDRGVRFVEGYFVLNDAQSLGAYSLSGGLRFYETPTTSVGFSVNKEFVTADDDDTLTDPAFGYYNYAAPGADRFKINMVLSQRGYTASDTSSTDNFSRVGFVEFLRMVDGDTIKIEKYPDYAMLEDTLARRTYDESGNYTVTPFDMSVRAATGPGPTLKAELSTGKAYVFGYEFETQGVTRLDIDKARTTRAVSAIKFDRDVGPWTKVTFSGVTGSFGNITDLGHDPVLIMVTGSSGQGDANKRIVGVVGTARMRRADLYSGSVFNLSLYDISFTGGADVDFGQVGRFFVQGVTNCDRHIFAITGGTAALEGVDQSTMLWEIPDGSVVSQLDSVDMAYTYHYPVTSVSSFPYNFTITNPIGSDGFAVGTEVSLPNADVIVLDQQGRVMSGTAAGVGNNLQITVQGTPSQSNKLFVMASVDYGALYSTSRTKTLATQNITLTGDFASLTGDGRGMTNNTLYFNGLVDVVSVVGMTGYKDGGQTGMLPYFTFDNGQRDDMYDWSRMTLNPNVSGITGPYTATVKVYTRSPVTPWQTTPFFTAGSYTGDDYVSDYIPSYTSKTTGKTYRLRDVIDFRPDRGVTFGAVTSLTAGYNWVPTNTAANDSQFGYTHYLPRVDKIVLTRDRKFEVIEGVPSVNSEPPVDNPNAMTLHVLSVNPYTFGNSDVTIRQIDNKRYTMRDIGELEKRIEAVEYYTSLNLLEQDAKAVSIKDDNDLEMPKKGIVVDQFRGHIVSDNEDPMFAASIDYERNELRPPFTVKSFSLTASTQFTFSGVTGNQTIGVFTLAGTTATGEIGNIVSSDFIKINPFGVVSFLGNLSISPASDTWFDDTKRPVVKVNSEGENDNWKTSPTYGFGTRYNDWESMWFGKNVVESNTSTQNSPQTRRIDARVNGVALNSVVSAGTKDSIKKKVVEKSIMKDVLPIARKQEINITAKGLKPNTNIYLYCDDVYATPYCVTGQAKTDSKGEITNLKFGFNYPNTQNTTDEEQNFTVGRHVIRVVGSDNLVANPAGLIHNPDLWCMSADAVYIAEGSYDSVTESGVLSTRLPTTKRKSAKSTRVISNLSEILTSSGEIMGYQEPLSQTFYVDPSKYPNGIFVSFIDLYFKSKDTATTIPVTVEIRPTISGYPHPSRVMPFASSSLYSDSISTTARISSGNDGVSRFNFTTPVYLLSGEEYAVCVSTNSDAYSVFTSSIGSIALKSNESDPSVVVAKQPGFRSLFKTQNAGKLTKTENESLCMRVGVTKFPSTGTITIPKAQVFGSDTNTYNSVRINGGVSLPEGCSYTTQLGGDQFDPNKNVTPHTGKIELGSGSKDLVFTLSSSNQYVTPVFDRERTSVVLIKNLINNLSDTTVGSETYNGELEPTNEGVNSARRTKARYITKQIGLEPEITASNITVKMSLNNPIVGTNNTSSVKVFIRSAPLGSTDFSKAKYIELTPSDSGYSYSKDDFREVTFTNISTGELPKFNTFSIKVVMFGNEDGSVYPRVRNLRVIAT